MPLDSPAGVAVDGDSVVILDSANGLVRRVRADGKVSKIAGRDRLSETTPSQLALEVDVRDAFGAAVRTSTGDLYLADTGNHVVRVIHRNGSSDVVAGNFQTAEQDDAVETDTDQGPALSVPLSSPIDVVLDEARDVLYISDWGRDAVFALDLAVEEPHLKVVVGVPGRGGGRLAPSPLDTALESPRGIAVDDEGRLLVADTGNHRVLRVDGDRVENIAGVGDEGFSGDGGPAEDAELSGPEDVAARGDTIVVADTGNLRIRSIDADGVITTITGNGVVDEDLAVDAPRETLQFHPSALAVTEEAIYVASVEGLWRIEDRHGYRVFDFDKTVAPDTAEPVTLLRHPTGIAADGDSLVVVDHATDVVLRMAVTA